ncbi:MAG TPA: sigma-70 family RNA polymerase sigma factor [Bryobacteraceae bacterium]|nr:sigma-70 family RNA polymerase sigma factor [Bryobacteraceae bacterium]
MEPTSKDSLTLLINHPEGNLRDCERLTEMVYEELRRIAQRLMASERCDHTLQATALVHEAYLRLQEQPEGSWESRSHFFAVAASTIRHILVDHGRRRKSVKRWGEAQRIDLDEGVNATTGNLEMYIALDQALARLEKQDKRQARIVELRYFAGITIEEIAAIMGISVRTVKRDWEVARLWLHAELSSRSKSQPSKNNPD